MDDSIGVCIGSNRIIDPYFGDGQTQEIVVYGSEIALGCDMSYHITADIVGHIVYSQSDLIFCDVKSGQRICPLGIDIVAIVIAVSTGSSQKQTQAGSQQEQYQCGVYFHLYLTTDFISIIIIASKKPTKCLYKRLE
jgi:hypothetical protein